jgi:predicted HTH domain antitoxin
MPPKTRTNASNLAEQEGRILLAISALEKKEISAISRAAQIFNVPRSTLRDRLKGSKYRNEARANGHKLTQNDVESLIRWILSIDQRRAAPRPSHVQEMANILLAQRGSTPIKTVGEKLVYNFVNWQDEIKTRFSRRYNHQRAKYEDPTVILEWFIVSRSP